VGAFVLYHILKKPDPIRTLKLSGIRQG